MSFIISFKTTDFVIMAGDKRITYVDGSGYKDDSRKVHKINDYIFGLAGSGELSQLFEQMNKSLNLKEFLSFSNEFFNMLQTSKSKDKTHWIKQRFDLTLQVAGVENNRMYLAMYQISWNEDGILFGVIPSTIDIPCFVMPFIKDDTLSVVEKYIKNNHPKTLEESKVVIDFLMNTVSSKSNEVSPEYDIEYFTI